MPYSKFLSQAGTAATFFLSLTIFGMSSFFGCNALLLLFLDMRYAKFAMSDAESRTHLFSFSEFYLTEQSFANWKDRSCPNPIKDHKSEKITRLRCWSGAKHQQEGHRKANTCQAKSSALGYSLTLVGSLSSSNPQAILKQSSSNPQAILKQSSSNPQAILKQSDAPINKNLRTKVSLLWYLTMFFSSEPLPPRPERTTRQMTFRHTASRVGMFFGHFINNHHMRLQPFRSTITVF